MKRSTAWNSKLLAAALVLAVSVSAALAGTPLLCHPFDIGNAKSLPWGGGVSNQVAEYDTRHLVDDTAALLNDAMPVIVRMETIRRAVYYTGRDAGLGEALVDRFRARAKAGETAVSRALALFDYGYLCETMKQASMMKATKAVGAAAGAIDGSSVIEEAIKLRGVDPEMEFAAALVTWWPKTDRHDEHLRIAAAGAAQDPLLAANLTSCFGKTIAELRTH